MCRKRIEELGNDLPDIAWGQIGPLRSYKFD
jgi:hypothetical protein